MLDIIHDVEITSFEGIEYSAYGLLKAVFNTKSHGLVEEHDLFRVALAMLEAEGTENEKFLRQAWERTKNDGESATQYQWQLHGFAEEFRRRFTPEKTTAQAVSEALQIAQERGIGIPAIIRPYF